MLRPVLDGAAPVRRSARRSSILARTLACADLLAAAAAAGSTMIAFGLGYREGLLLVLIAAVVWPAIAFCFGLYGGSDLRTWVSGVSEIPRGLAATLVFSWPVFGAGSLLELPSPGALTAWMLVATVVFTGAARAAVRAGLHRSQELQQRTVILGSGVVAGQLVEKLRAHNQFGLVPMGIIDDEIYEVGGPRLPRLGGFDDLGQVLREWDVDRVIIAFSRASHEQLLQCMRACRDHHVSIDVIPRLFEFLDGVGALNHIGGLPVLSMGSPRLSRSAQIAKRALDVALSALILLATAPLILLTAVAIKLDSRGPVFFRQPRVGRGREVFNMLKFRSMHADADLRKPELESRNSLTDGVMFKIHADPRVTRVGRVLRRLSLDELPQLFNVVAGQMSLVGPRPLILTETNALAEEWHLRRLDLRPGLTGPWQVYGRSNTPFQEMVRLDYQYVTGWSLARDVEILLSTLPAILSGRGAY